MSNTDLIIEERARDIGDFLVGRLLPFRKKRMVGPFIFVDHMGPVDLKPGHYADIGQHPHVGLSTLTFLLEGEMMHQDSIGSKQRISPGSVNWMTAGKGVTHTERTPDDLKEGTLRMHGYQIWVALPKEKEDMEPEFHHIDAKDLPAWKENGMQLRLIAGKAYHRESPLPVHSELFMVEVISALGGDLDTANNLFGEIGICIVEGVIQACEHRIEKGHMLVAKSKDTCKIKLQPNTHLLIFGGTPFPEERYIDWNFVSYDRAKLEKARKDWQEKRFPMIEGEESYIPYPSLKK
ncbi:MAG: pirin family protein [Bacteroidetes bacterium]|nr:pirin family protein [Bacteroidota bacterium]